MYNIGAGVVVVGREWTEREEESEERKTVLKYEFQISKFRKRDRHSEECRTTPLRHRLHDTEDSRPRPSVSRTIWRLRVNTFVSRTILIPPIGFPSSS